MSVNSTDNSNLTYTAPKQPKKLQNNEQQKVSSSVIVAKVINLWKIENSKDKTPYGKHGMAIVTVNDESNISKECIIYKNKNNILIRCRLKEQTFTWHNYNNCFGTFYDTSKVLWMVKFESSSDENIFLNEFTLSNCKITRNEQPNKTKETDDTKAEILTRITKMGQQILPKTQIKKSTTSTPSSSSSSDVETNKQTRHKPTVLSRKTKNPPNSSHVTMLVPAQSISNNNNDMNIAINSNAMVPSACNNDSFSNFLLMQNMEMKTTLNLLTNKLDTVLNQNSGNNDDLNSLKSKLKVLELQNSNLKSELLQVGNNEQAKYNLKIQELELLQKKNAELEKYQSDIQAKLRGKSLDDALNELENNKSSISDLTDKIVQLEGKLEETFTSVNNKADIVKGHINILYQNILLHFNNEDEMFSSKIIQDVFAKHLKQTTYNMLRDLNDDNNNKKIFTN